jgi:hypothetical protein
MTNMIKTLALGAGFAALAAASPASAQYYPPYGNAYGYYNHNVTDMAAQRCAAAVQNRLSYRGTRGILGSLFGVNSYNNARVLSITRVFPRRTSVRVSGVASSGRLAYNPYGVGAYGMLGSNYGTAADLSFGCSVDYRGRITDLDINRR